MTCATATASNNTSTNYSTFSGVGFVVTTSLWWLWLLASKRSLLPSFSAPDEKMKYETHHQPKRRTTHTELTNDTTITKKECHSNNNFTTNDGKDDIIDRRRRFAITKTRMPIYPSVVVLLDSIHWPSALFHATNRTYQAARAQGADGCGMIRRVPK